MLACIFSYINSKSRSNLSGGVLKTTALSEILKVSRKKPLFENSLWLAAAKYFERELHFIFDRSPGSAFDKDIILKRVEKEFFFSNTASLGSTSSLEI